MEAVVARNAVEGKHIVELHNCAAFAKPQSSSPGTAPEARDVLPFTLDTRFQFEMLEDTRPRLARHVSREMAPIARSTTTYHGQCHLPLLFPYSNPGNNSLIWIPAVRCSLDPRVLHEELVQHFLLHRTISSIPF